MDTEDEPTSPSSPMDLPHSCFRLFTRESLVRIEQAIEEEARIKEREAEEAKEKKEEQQADDDDENKPRPNHRLEQGNKLPKKFGEFPKELMGKPIEDLDEFYHNQYTFMVVGKDHNMYRFSATKAVFLLSPFHPLRRTALFVLTHPYFNFFVMLTILVNCGFMCVNAKNPDGTDKFKTAEYAFTAIYTAEMLIKITARGFILKPFTYLRDMWNWLDFIVVSLAYITEILPILLPKREGSEGGGMGNVAAIRTFRVLRALKTVAVMPGLKTIVGALMEAVRRLRDVMILTCFVLSIFALIGLQLYSGSLRQKCVKDYPVHLQNISEDKDDPLHYLKKEWYSNESNWYRDENNDTKLCSKGLCPLNFTVCEKAGDNPNFGYTHFDNFPGAMLCAFRLMTQDYWENLYQIIIRANGPYQLIFFVIVILLGSFYLVNLTLAIVAMSYDEVRKANKEEEEEEEQEREDEEARRLQEEANQENQMAAMRRSPSDYSCASNMEMDVPGKNKPPEDRDRQSVRSDTGTEGPRRLSVINSRGKRTSLSLPGSPFPLRRSSKGSFTWRRPMPRGDKQPLVLPCLDNLPLPYADDSNAVSPSSEDLCNTPSHTHMLIARRRLSSASYHSKNLTLDGGIPFGGSRRASMASHRSSRQSFGSRGSFIRHTGDRPKEPTHFQWLSVKKKKRPKNLSDLAAGKGKDDHETSSEGSEYDAKHKLFAGNPYVCPTPTVAQVELQDIMDLKDMVYEASGKRASFLSEEHLTFKEVVARKIQYVLNYEPHPYWKKFSRWIELFVMDAFVDLFITLCIVVNTIFMAMDEPHSTDVHKMKVLEIGNYVFTGIFTAEAVLKIIAMNPVNYLKDNWNCFDIVIVILSLIELLFKDVKGFSILRSFRLLRVFKLAKSWPTLNLLIGIISRTLAALGNLTFVLLIVIFIFAVMGMQLFGGSYVKDNFEENEIPRWNFTDFLHSFMIVFRVLCGEWIESMWDCMRATKSGAMCVPFFLLTYIAGNLVVLNLFLALLLSSFGAETLQRSTDDDGEPNKLQEAVDRINRFVMFCKSHIMYCIKVKCRKKRPSSPGPVETKSDLKEILVDGQVPMGNGRVCDHEGDGSDSDSSSSSSSASDLSDTEDHKKNGDAPTRPVSQTSLSETKMSKTSSVESKSPLSTSSNLSCSHEDIGKPIDIFDGPEINEVQVVFTRYPDDCLPSVCMKRMPCCDTLITSKCGKAWWTFRCYMFQLVEHKYFETFIITMIVTSSLALAIEDKNIHKPDRVILKKALQYMDKIFSVIFVIEMLIKWAALGFKKYFTDAWCWLDFVIVSISIVSWAAEGAGMGNIGAFRALRTLRALRPLRAVSRWEGMKVVVNALIQAIPSICNVFVVCMVFWLIFSIMGVNLFGGRYRKCLDADGNLVNYTIVKNESMCLALNASGYKWVNSKINFDNVFNGYLALFQVATFKGWVPIMNDAIDSQSEVNAQHIKEGRVFMYFYFVVFIVFGSFFTLNLFIGVIIDNFNMQKKKAGGSLEMFMTEDQKRYYNAMKKLGSKAPKPAIPKPRMKCQRFFFTLTTNQKFDIGIMVVIMLNMITMAIEHYDMEPAFASALEIINYIFIAIFTLECVMKIVGLRQFYFKEAWNIFDFVVVVLSLLAIALKDITKKLPISPTLLRVIRVFRVGRVLRLVKSAKGIRTLLFSLAVSMPALFNIGLLLFLVIFIFSIFGMNFFMYVKYNNGIDDIFNFETFGRSLTTLFQMCTSAGWAGVLAGLMVTPPECDPSEKPNMPHGDCGSPTIATFFLIAYLMVTFLVIINMYIAVILENFSQATEDVQQGLTQDDFDMYYEIWEKFDQSATQYIELETLPTLVDTLEEPLRLPMPNHYLLVKLDIPICKDDRVHCVDILDALTKNFLGTSGDAAELADVKKGPEKVDYFPTSSTLKRQREIVCARIVQRAWRKHVEKNKAIRGENPNAAPDRTVIILEPPVEESGEELAEADHPESPTSMLQTVEGGENTDPRTVELYPHSDSVA